MAINSDPQFCSLQQQRDSLFKLGKYSEAVESFDLAIKYDSNNSKAYNNKGTALFKLGKYKESLMAYGWAIKCKLKMLKDSISSFF